MKKRLLFILLFVSSFAFAQTIDFDEINIKIQTLGNKAISSYTANSAMDVGDTFSDLYFDVFEGEGMEQEIALSDPSLKTKLESEFNAVIGQAMRLAPKENVEKAWQALSKSLQQTADNHQSPESSFISVLLQSFFILLREGFEAMLVIMALVTYLRRTNPERVKIIWYGVYLALIASFATAYLITSVYEISGEAQEALEGVTMLLAAAVLFYVSYWLISKSESTKWQKYINTKIGAAVKTGSAYTLAFAAFLAVYREGAETVLFYQALALGASDQSMALVSGFALALVSLIILFFIMRSATMRLPMGLFFSVTAILLYYLAFVFVGKGILELQLAHWITSTPIESMISIEFLGIFPTIEGVISQLVFLLPLPIAYYVLSKRGKNV
ncbi:MAG: FTR1 family iron permease [Candidatus Thioglobus sp.]|jgi:high-affinity iron transporter|nr:FTR1 family iron permease [Candidatus Thioglobus sp.]